MVVLEEVHLEKRIRSNNKGIGSFSEAKSTTKSRPFNIFMDVLLINWLFNDFFGAERNISGRVKIDRFLMEGSFSSPPLFDFMDLCLKMLVQFLAFGFLELERFFRRKE